MTDHELTDIHQAPEDHRGFISYIQEYGYKMITISVSVALGERSHVTSHAYNLPISEEAERLQGVDLYHFAVTDGTQIQLTFETLAGNKEAWYTVRPDGIIAEPSPIAMTIGCSEESPSFGSAFTREALDEALQSYTDQIDDWLDLAPMSNSLDDLPDFGR